jgi:hypothetical protein
VTEEEFALTKATHLELREKLLKDLVDTSLEDEELERGEVAEATDVSAASEAKF